MIRPRETVRLVTEIQLRITRISASYFPNSLDPHLEVNKPSTILKLLVVSAALLVELSAFSSSPPSIAAKRISSSITLDGKLEEPEWQQAQTIELIQQAPRPGQPSPYKTEIKILTSSEAIYFGFICHDTNPKAIAVHTQRRDGDVTGDDTVAIVLDTYGDRRTGYFFQINAVGTRVDGLI